MENDAITAARELAPLITRLRHETEANRLIAPPVVDRLRATRLGRLSVARELAGLELPTAAGLEVYEELAAAEASVAWIVWNNSLPCFLGRYLDRAARAEIFADPDWLYAISTRPTGRAVVAGDGYRIEGRWALVSGCELAEWIALLCVVVEDGQPRMIAPGVPETRFLFVRRGDYEILDTWRVGGLRGTGSHDVVVGGRPVSRERTFAPGDPSTLDGPLGRIPIIATMAAGYAAQMLGVARTAVDTLFELAKTKITPVPTPDPRDRPALQVAIAIRPAALEAARSHLRSRTRRLWDTAAGGAAPTIEAISDLWTAAHHAVWVARDAVDAMYEAGGTSSLYVDCPLERAHRDVHAMLRHLVGQPSWLEDAGRVRLGMAPQHPLYAI
jgi:alkylation response protein AidB-like acyl-CoA dehydrogenase